MKQVQCKLNPSTGLDPQVGADSNVSSLYLPNTTFLGHCDAGAGLDPQAGDMPQMQSPSTTARHGGGSSSSGYG
eukprot:scaffold27534_cov20-Tisochrysis_lutea.AAC.1